MNAVEVRWMDEVKRGAVGGDVEEAAVAITVDFHVGEGGLQSSRQRGRKKVLAGFNMAEGVDDERAVGAQNLADGRERFARQQVRGGGIAEKGIEDDRIILFAAAIEKMASIVNGEMQAFGLKTEEAGGDGHDRGVDLHDVHARAVVR